MSFTIKGNIASIVVPGLGATAAAAPTVTPTGTAGSTTAQYEVVAVFPNGDALPSPVGQTTTGNATLSSTNYNALSWTAVTGAIGYRVLKNVSGTYQLLANTTATSLNDQGQFTPSAYVPTSASVGTINIFITPGAGDEGSAQQGGWITMEATAANIAAASLATGSCTLTVTQP